jgi:hypothetical protein
MSENNNQELITTLNNKLSQEATHLTYPEYVKKIREEYCENINDDSELQDHFEFQDESYEIHYSHPNLLDVYKKNYNEYLFNYLLYHVKEIKIANEYKIADIMRLEYKIEHLENENEVERERINNLEMIVSALNHKVQYQSKRIKYLERFVLFSSLSLALLCFSY